MCNLTDRFYFFTPMTNMSFPNHVENSPCSNLLYSSTTKYKGTA